MPDSPHSPAWTQADFDSLVGSNVDVVLTDGCYPLEVKGTRRIFAGGEGIAGKREPFAVDFLGKESSRYLPQRTFLFRHPSLGELEIFVVPLGPEPASGRMRYEAVFT